MVSGSVTNLMQICREWFQKGRWGWGGGGGGRAKRGLASYQGGLSIKSLFHCIL